MGAPYRVGVVGLGYFSQFHLAAWQAHPEVELVAVTDLDAARREWAAAEYAAPVVEDLAGVLTAEPDIMDIVAPPPAHAALIRACLAAERTLICQKPFCTSLEEARAVTDKATSTGTRIIIHENFRFQPWHRTIHDLIADGALGQVYSARFALRPGDGRGPEAYLARQPAFQTMPRLLIHETGVHFIDLFRWLLGEVTAVYADLRQLNPVLAGEDAGVLMMDHAGGARSIFDGNRLSDHVSDNPRRTMGEMVIEADGGTVTLDGAGRVWLRAFGTQEAQQVPLVSAPDDASFGGGCVAALIGHVVDALKGRAAFENEAADYLPVIALTDLAYASAAAGRKLAVPSEG